MTEVSRYVTAEIKEQAAQAFFDAGGLVDTGTPVALRAALEAVAGDIAEAVRREEAESIYRAIERQARNIDSDLEGYSPEDLAANMRLLLEGRLEDAAEAARREERERIARAILAAKPAPNQHLTFEGGLRCAARIARESSP